MPYHTVQIGKLSPTQISKILNSHPVRIKGGSAHSIGLSKEQMKKFSKAHHLGKALTISFDPFQIHNHQHLRGKGTGTDLGKTLGGVAGHAAETAAIRLDSAIAGTDSKANQDQYQTEPTTGGKLTYTANIPTYYGPNSPNNPKYNGGKVNRLSKAKKWLDFVQNDLGAQQVQDALMNRAASSVTYGGAVNRLNKSKRWTNFVQDDLGMQPVQDALMNRGAAAITYGGTVNRLNKAQRWTNFVQDDLGMQPVQDALMNRGAAAITYGFGLKKRVAKKRSKSLSGRSLYNAGIGPA